mmetsp:Transcript_1358/g.2456  ORF Transcript_1358/g.2456 Transcript_1358/m.2456 type:complete len:86 (+) Transcript_1358:2255-2512(+)
MNRNILGPRGNSKDKTIVVAIKINSPDFIFERDSLVKRVKTNRFMEVEEAVMAGDLLTLADDVPPLRDGNDAVDAEGPKDDELDL